MGYGFSTMLCYIEEYKFRICYQIRTEYMIGIHQGMIPPGSEGVIPVPEEDAPLGLRIKLSMM